MPATRTYRSGTDFHAFAQDAASSLADATPKRAPFFGRLELVLREQLAGELAFCRDLATRLRPARAAQHSHAAVAEGDWPERLDREYVEDFMPVRPGQRWAAGAAEKIPGHSNRAGVVLLGAGRALWVAATLLRPLGHAVFAWRGVLAKAAVIGLAVLAGGDLLAKWPESQKTAFRASAAAPRDAWIEIVKPYQLYELSAPLLAREKHAYSARRHAAGGGREDILTFGQFAVEKTAPFVRLSVYRHGSERIEETPFFVEMARRAAPLGLSVSAVRQEPDQATRFGDLETAALTLSQNDFSRDRCRGFRLVRAQPGLTIAGLACAAEDESMSAENVACLLNRLDLLAAGSDRPLRDFFGAAEARNVRGCNETVRRR